MNENLLQKEAKMMKLEKLIAQREGVSTKPFPLPVKELLQRYEQLYTGAISDVLREFCLLDQSLPGHLRPLRDSDVVAGIAFTVKSAPNVKITGEMTFRTQMLDEMGEAFFGGQFEAGAPLDPESDGTTPHMRQGLDEDLGALGRDGTEGALGHPKSVAHWPARVRIRPAPPASGISPGGGSPARPGA